MIIDYEDERAFARKKLKAALTRALKNVVIVFVSEEGI